MTEIVVSSSQRMEGVDPSRVWAFVADPARVASWAPVRSAEFMGTELPNVGHVVFLRRGASEEAVWRCKIDEWEAGHRVACALDSPGPAAEQRLEITVETRGTGAKPDAEIRITYRGDVPPLAAPLYRWRIRALEQRSLRGIARHLGVG